MVALLARDGILTIVHDATTIEIAGDLATRLRALRAARGWSRAELARRSGVSATAIGRIERGERRPINGTVQALANALDVRPVALREVTNA